MTERLVDRQVVHDGNYLSFVVDTIVDSEGRKHTRDVALHPGAVAMVALTGDRQLLLVRQYRHAAGVELLELPAGTLDTGPDGVKEDPLLAAKRELLEETGHSGEHWRKLAEFFTAPGFATELMHLYLATDVEPDPDYKGAMEDEILELEKMSFEDALALADDGKIRDAKTIAGLYMVDRLARLGKIKALDRG